MVQLQTGSSTIETKKHTPLVVLRCCCKPWPNQFWIRQVQIHKGPLLHGLIQCSDLDILVETHIRPTDTDGLLNSLTPPNYNLIQKPRCTGLGGGVGFLCRKSFSPSIVSSPVFRSFEIIILSFRSDYNSFVVACVYHAPGSCTTQFLEDFLAFSGSLSSICSNFISTPRAKDMVEGYVILFLNLFTTFKLLLFLYNLYTFTAL